MADSRYDACCVRDRLNAVAKHRKISRNKLSKATPRAKQIVNNIDKQARVSRSVKPNTVHELEVELGLDRGVLTGEAGLSSGSPSTLSTSANIHAAVVLVVEELYNDNGELAANAVVTALEWHNKGIDKKPISSFDIRPVIIGLKNADKFKS